MTRHQGVMLAGLGVVLFLAASADGLTARHGQILITAAVVWLWISAASRPPIDPAATPARRQRFLIDWSGPLRRPVSTKVKAGVIGAMACVPAIYWICEPAGLTGPSTLLAVMHFGVFAAAAIIVGPGFAQRSAGATLVLSLLLGVGGAALSRIGAIWSIWYGADPLAPVRPTQVLGVSALRSTSILVMAIGVLALLQFRRVRTVSAVLTAAVLFIAAIIVLLSGSEPTLRVMGSAVATAINSLLDAVREAGA